MPPAAVIRRPDCRASFSIPAMFGPMSVPSRITSVYWMRGTPQLFTRSARSTASTRVISFHPATATLPLRASRATATLFGTAAVADPGVVEAAARLWPERVAVALDARNGKVAVSGWKEITRVDAADLAEQVKGWGVPRIQYTDVMRDGTLMGPNIAGIEKLARQSGLRITAAGGISILEDLTRLRELEAVGVDEIVVGKALYEKRFTLAQAIQAVS